MRKISFLLLLLLAIVADAQQRTVTNYVKQGLRTTLRIAWDSHNYGTIQWQQSSDQGRTWTDISGANGREYAVTPQQDAYLRVVVRGDEACEPFVETHILRTVSFTVDLVGALSREATYEIRGLNVPRQEVVDYGFCYNVSGVNRTYTSMQRQSLGSELPEGDAFELTCTELQPNRQYSMRFYFSTKDGSTIYGPGKLTKTLDGLEWSSEEWTITKTAVKARFALSGFTGAKPQMTFSFGEDDAHLQQYQISVVNA